MTEKDIDNKIGLRDSGVKSTNNYNSFINNDNIINDTIKNNNKQIKGQILNWHQLYYYQNGSQNQIISNNDYSNNNYN